MDKYSQTTERPIKGKKSKDFQALEEVSSRRESRQTGEPQVLLAHLTPEMIDLVVAVSSDRGLVCLQDSKQVELCNEYKLEYLRNEDLSARVPVVPPQSVFPIPLLRAIC